MPSSKGKPTDPKLREKVKNEVQNETNKDGSGKGQWSAWKSAKLSKEYEKRGGDYENEPGSKNEPRKGTPEEKSGKKRKREVNKAEHGEAEEEVAEEEEGSAKQAKAGKKETQARKKEEEKGSKGKKGGKQTPIEEKDTPKANGKKNPGRPRKENKPKEKVPREGTRKSARIKEAESQNGGQRKKQKTDYLQF
ncbi:hypothetical protein DIS24_g7832 [Lasiodiplodia hormozganensis]|uniref:Uncharacterized protein n=1 Tax=Lasiodiplodia hormozganensis TaxID=869390 RepID=A0AA39Y7X1_9PEZI|nr:hypothetical protein DIS24_g7832 [Lasiodiplodia hormozganensis]